MRRSIARKIGITGSYGGLNLGDEAILQSMLTQLRRTQKIDVTVPPLPTLPTSKANDALPMVTPASNPALPAIPDIDAPPIAPNFPAVPEATRPTNSPGTTPRPTVLPASSGPR